MSGTIKKIDSDKYISMFGARSNISLLDDIYGSVKCGTIKCAFNSFDRCTRKSGICKTWKDIVYEEGEQ